MATLSRELRNDLQRVVLSARKTAEVGARKALEASAVHHHEPWPNMSAEARALRNRLRAHGRQLGDQRDERRGAQAVDRLVGECAYEHWHRMLFARFLAECDLLIEPETGVPISLDECRELALERQTDWLQLASTFAVRMLPQIFRQGDPVLDVALPPETRQVLEKALKSLSRDVFLADDSLGWVYQYWQTERKDAINKSEKKIGADELPAVTQLFTEDYMVLFLLHNTLGAWWAGKVLGKQPVLAASASSEDELRAACAVGSVEWTYLRFVREDGGSWRPAAGTFEGWPKAAKDVTVLDPCMGSGHFLVFALPILAAFRMEEEGLSREQSVDAVLRDNLFGLEIDPRCTQIAAFNLAVAAWKMTEHRTLPQLNLACSGLAINASEQDWLALAHEDERLQAAMRQLYRLFEQAPVLGSLVDPKRVGGDLFTARSAEVVSLLRQALAGEQSDTASNELAVAARGLLHAAGMLGDAFTLVTTNVPYLGLRKQSDTIKDLCISLYPAARAETATSFVQRCLGLCAPGGSSALVTPQNWLFLGSYKPLRQLLLRSAQWDSVVRLGPHAFETITGEVVNVAMVGLSCRDSRGGHCLASLDVVSEPSPTAKAMALPAAAVGLVSQSERLHSPDAGIATTASPRRGTIDGCATNHQGLTTGDNPRFRRASWEVAGLGTEWEPEQSSVETTRLYGGRSGILLWEGGDGRLREFGRENVRALHNVDRRGEEAWGSRGIAVTQMGDLPATIYGGERFDTSVAVLVPRQSEHLLPLWCFCSSPHFKDCVRALNAKRSVDNGYFARVPFDRDHWQHVAAEKYPHGLPKPQSNDPTQWLFDGHPKGADHPLQVAVARLVGYRWPRQTGSSLPDCPALGPDGLERHADDDGIVSLTPLKGEPPAADRLRALLADAYGSEWSADQQARLLTQAGHAGDSLEEWLRDSFFVEHCDLFHQRPFVWHIWDGLQNGFAVLVNAHRLAGGDGGGRRTLEKLIYSYLGDWLDRQRADQASGVEGADARVAAAQHLRAELEKILEGEPPYDIFVRWKALHEQPVGWEPDINDGIRLNIRPFMTARPLGARARNACILRVSPRIKWDKDRGKEPERPRQDFPWFWSWDEKSDDFAGGKTFDGNRWNNLHYSRTFKLAARERHAAEGQR